MKPWLGNRDIEMFYNCLDNAKVYFEYGSGGSTYQALVRKNIEKMYTVENKKKWQKTVQKLIKKHLIRPTIKILNKDNMTMVKEQQEQGGARRTAIYIYNKMPIEPKTLGFPSIQASNQQKINYSDQIVNLNDEDKKLIDLVFIDGRFRAACCLKCYNVIRDDCLIAFDDFLNRDYYHIVLDYFDIINSTEDNRMVILKKKLNKEIPNELIEKYELIAD